MVVEGWVEDGGIGLVQCNIRPAELPKVGCCRLAREAGRQLGYGGQGCGSGGGMIIYLPTSAANRQWLELKLHLPLRRLNTARLPSSISSSFGGAPQDSARPMGYLLFSVTVLLFTAAIFASQSPVLTATPVHKLKLNSKLLQQSIIRKVNGNPQSGWEAAMNPRFSNYTVGEFRRLLGVRFTPECERKSIPVMSHSKSLKLPANFDARTAWPQCSTISRILDQGHCGSCWAFGAVESLSDRFCINFDMNISLSVNDLLACCGILCGAGCEGGTPIHAWRYFVHHGVVTEQCDPYFDDIGCSHPGCEPEYPTPKCKKHCVDENQLWRKSKHYSVNAYRINSDPQDIMAEVYKNGPVEVAFTVYEDFAHYKKGVYKHVTGDMLGGHAVKLIGWGTTDDGEDYWLLANQWNRSWGDDGYFKIKRGTNECGIEDDVIAGLQLGCAGLNSGDHTRDFDASTLQKFTLQQILLAKIAFPLAEQGK
ncbi:hypothetical protein Nepgr_022685 [Nepenthes gracilis]|uniref:Peptidase C1A papain C-terminal domain-containing protein n=1 Tax=Nepenthes gracilis TaxID=150966 RepID=A0AAD3T0S1_NEPGR|nr:hypothetical protein Nepgr_022685 [Nepenthes gracilis]